MNLLARLMSHGFAISLVVLLGIGFIYRGELFPEWELPAFLVFDSDKGTSEEPLAGKIEPAPMQDEWMGAATATNGQEVVIVADDPASTDAAEIASKAAATAITDEKAVVAGVVETVEEAGAGMPASATIDTAVSHTAEDIPVGDVTSAMTAGVAAKTTASATEVTGVTQTTTAIADAAMKPEAVSGVIGMPEPQAASVSKDATSEAASAAEAAAAPVRADVSKPVAQVKADASTAAVITESAATGADLADAPVAGAVEATVAAPITAPADSGVQGATPQAADDSATSSYQLLALAREAYWMRDYQAAEDYYRQMIQLHPQDPDGYGELANLYFSQGNWEEAAAAYYEAGSRLVKSGLLTPARGLVDVIRGLKGPQADALEQEIETAQASSQ